MLVLLSDLHISDSTASTNVHPTAFTDVLLPEIISNAKNKDAMEIRVVLLGDIFDLVRSIRWLEVKPIERPWNGILDEETAMNINPKVEEHYTNILKDILKNESSQVLFDVLGKIKDSHKNVYTKITYVIGNHDRVFHNFPTLQKMFIDKIKNVDQVEFLNLLLAEEYNIIARHGHEWDDLCYGQMIYNTFHPNSKIDRFDDRCAKVQTIGEVLTTELLSGVIYRIKQKDEQFAKQLLDINNIRPMLDIFSWLGWSLKDKLSPERKKILIDALIDSLETGVLKSTLIRKWIELKEKSFLKIDIDKILLKILSLLKSAKYDDFESVANYIKNFITKRKDTLLQGAKSEFTKGIPKGLQYIVYGHTHNALECYFSAKQDGMINLYRNTGTYLPLIESAEDKSYYNVYRMSLSFFYRADEDLDGKKKGTSADIWDGQKRKIYCTSDNHNNIH
jgi:UDP-2,3-diacylglucosamine pyrophosphatase LpxH